MQQKWFRSWFNSPYYHILYSGRNDAEAELLIDNLTNFLQPKSGARMLDIACGKGRHSVFLRKKGFDVTGIDLSENSINHAKISEDEHLHFFVHDMRKLLYINYFDISFNLFTSFGYFETEKDHINALKAFRKGLKNDGTLVLDYFNTTKVLNNLVPDATLSVNGIEFKLKKKLINGKLVKEIKFYDKGRAFAFNEIVQAFTFDDFQRILTAAGLSIIATFGNYHLDDFDVQNSDRLIMICKKL